jgi:chorismate dehydratase
MTSANPFQSSSCATISGARTPTDTTPHTRIGAVAYLNTKPLIYDLAERLEETSSLELELPSRLADRMNRGQLDIALLPIVEYLRHRENYRPISNAGIACRGPVWSVRILFRVPPEKARTLGTDEGSRTSVALSQVLLASRYGHLLDEIPFPLGTEPKDCPADAVLIIGDRAMNPERFAKDFICDWDLGLEWFRETGLPFIFAMWIARNDSFASHETIAALEASRDQGLLHVEQLVERHSANYGLSPEACREYLTHYLRFRVGEIELAGLEEFASRCENLGLVPRHTHLEKVD